MAGGLALPKTLLYFSSKTVINIPSVSEGTTPREIVVGSTVRITGDKYATGQSVALYARNITHVVAQINGDRVLLGFPDGICSWVYLKDFGVIL